MNSGALNPHPPILWPHVICYWKWHPPGSVHNLSLIFVTLPTMRPSRQLKPNWIRTHHVPPHKLPSPTGPTVTPRVPEHSLININFLKQTRNKPVPPKIKLRETDAHVSGSPTMVAPRHKVTSTTHRLKFVNDCTPMRHSWRNHYYISATTTSLPARRLAIFIVTYSKQT